MGRGRKSRRQAPATRPDAHPSLRPPDETPALTHWSLALFIAAAAVIAHGASRNCGYVNWDDADYIPRNKLVTGDGGLRAIWTDLADEESHQQYYPLTFTSLWIEHQFVGSEPHLYHTTQVILHALNAVIIFFTLRWLGLPLFACAAAGLLFAVHPINVASVAWLAERKNTLSGVFFWLALLLYAQFRRRRGSWRYAAALAAFLLGLFAKTALVVLAPVLIVTDRLLDGRWSLASLKRAAPFFFIAVVMAMITSGVEARISRSGEPVDIVLRPFIAAAALCHYVAKVALPINLLPIYPRWPESFAEPRYWLCAVILGAVTAALIRYRKRISPFVLWGVALFLLAAAPTLGFKHFNFLQYAFVSDHFIYLASVGLFVVIAIALNQLARNASRVAATAILLIAVAACSWISIRQCRVWQTPVTFWQHTLAGNPDLFAGHFNLARHYARSGQHEAALSCYREAARTRPDHANTRRFAAQSCMQLGRDDDAVQFYRDAIAVLERTHRTSTDARLELAAYLTRLGRTNDAADEYRRILRVQPNNRRARIGLDELTNETQQNGPQ